MRRTLLLTTTFMVLAGINVWAREAAELPMVAFANLESTVNGGGINGEVRIYEIEGGLKIIGNVSGNITPGKHGIHIHEHGNCSDGGNAAGGHYNPHGTAHGYYPDHGKDEAHLGDMGNVEIDENGHGTFSVDMPHLSIHGENSVEGRAIILHEKEDDFGQPTGNAGGRIACGVIEDVNTDLMGTQEDAPMHEGQ